MNGFKWIEAQRETSLALLIEWASINSWSHNAAGLERMQEALKAAFAPLADESEGLSFIKRKSLAKRILLGGHMDTVHPPHSTFQHCSLEGKRLVGPGVADMKGGLMVLWLALSAFEKFSPTKSFGWEIFINSDEEIGSPGSRALWEEKGRQAVLALLFEPSFSDGALVDRRKGSVTYKLTVKGRAAHVGRDFEKGRSAVHAISLFISEAYLAAKEFPSLTLNVGELSGESLVNIVAEAARCTINTRSFENEDLIKMGERLTKLAKEIAAQSETSLELKISNEKKAKLFTNGTKKLFEDLRILASELNMTLTTRSSGGLSDGNILAAIDLPCIDTLGVIGGHLHTTEEYMEIESMIERAKLTFFFLNRYAEGL